MKLFKLTTDVTGEALNSGLTDEAGYTVGGGGSNFKYETAGILKFGNGRFKTEVKMEFFFYDTFATL